MIIITLNNKTEPAAVNLWARKEEQRIYLYNMHLYVYRSFVATTRRDARGVLYTRIIRHRRTYLRVMNDPDRTTLLE